MVQRNYPLAREWFLKASAKDHTQAMNLLGHLYQEGLGVPQDYVQARNWYQQAADKGLPAAANNLGWLYLKGLGAVPRIAGRSPSYNVRQLYDIKHGARAGVGSALMKEVVNKLSEDDMVAISAYLASLNQ